MVPKLAGLGQDRFDTLDKVHTGSREGESGR